MNENRPQRMQVENLLAQDAAVSSFQFEEFRMNLELSIRRLEQRAGTINRASFWGVGILITFILSIIPLEGFGVFNKHEWLRPVWSGCGLIAMFTTGVLASIYQYRYQPALERAKSDLQTTMIVQLQQQVAELSRKLDSQ